MTLARSWALSFPIQHACYFIHAVNSECGGQRSVLGTIPQVPCHSLWVLETGSGAFRLVRMAVRWAPVNPASAFIVLGLQWCPPHLSSYMGSGCWIQSLKLSQHTLHPLICLLSPSITLVLSFPPPTGIPSMLSWKMITPATVCGHADSLKSLPGKVKRNGLRMEIHKPLLSKALIGRTPFILLTSWANSKF